MKAESIKYINEIKNVPCMDCNQKFPSYVMDFDHRDRTSKEYSVSEMLYNFGLEKIKKEISKCDIVCSNCHRIRTWGNSSIVEQSPV